jgi:hypothetical protein
MKSPRLPRFKRAPTVAPMQLTERDRDIIRLVYQNRFLRSSHIVALMGGSQQILRRLQLLYHHGFLERPRCQLDYYYRGGSREIVYGLADKGGAVLRQGGIALSESRWSDKNRSVGRVQLEHLLMVSDVIVAIEMVCRNNGSRLIMGDYLPVPGKHPSFRWNVDIGGGVKLGIAPDRAFALDYADPDDERKRAFFFLEADRGTMPIVRKNLSQSSFYRKLLAYEATWSQGLHRSQFVFNRFRVLTVTTSAARVNSLVEACSQLKKGHGLFLFTDQETLQKQGDILTLPWKTGRQSETSRILE